MNEFRYKAKTYIIKNWDALEAMRADVEKMFNDGWKPTTNGPCLAIPGEKREYPEHPVIPPGGGISIAEMVAEVEVTTWILMYVFAKEKSHAHVN